MTDLVRDEKDLPFVEEGRDYAMGSLLCHLMFLNTFSPKNWGSEFTNALAMIDPDAFHQDKVDDSISAVALRRRASFHTLKYILGCYDWNKHENCPVEPFPACYGLETADDKKTHKKQLKKFKKVVFVNVWCAFLRKKKGGVRIFDVGMIERAKEAFKHKTIGKFTNLSEDMKKPYQSGLNFSFSKEVKIPVTIDKNSSLSGIDLVGLLFAFIYAHQVEIAPITFSEGEHNNELSESTTKGFSFKNAIYTITSRHIKDFLTVSPGGATLRPDAVKKGRSKVVNPIFMYARFVKKGIERNFFSTDFLRILEENGFLSRRLFQVDFGQVVSDCTKKKGKRKSFQETEKEEIRKIVENYKKSRPIEVEDWHPKELDLKHQKKKEESATQESASQESTNSESEEKVKPDADVEEDEKDPSTEKEKPDIGGQQVDSDMQITKEETESMNEDQEEKGETSSPPLCQDQEYLEREA